jgi:hypothetical protein
MSQAWQISASSGFADGSVFMGNELIRDHLNAGAPRSSGKVGLSDSLAWPTSVVPGNVGLRGSARVSLI